MSKPFYIYQVLSADEGFVVICKPLDPDGPWFPLQIVLHSLPNATKLADLLTVTQALSPSLIKA